MLNKAKPTIMKKIILSVFTVALVSFSLLLTTPVNADEPPNPGGDPSGGGSPVGGGSPIGGGLIILATLGAAYGAKKHFDNKK